MFSGLFEERIEFFIHSSGERNTLGENISIQDFSNIIGKADVKQLAEADEQEVVRDLQEFFIDLFPLTAQLASIGMTRPYENPLSLTVQAQRRCTESILSLLLALKKRPLIRSQKSSEDAQKIANKVSEVHELLTFNKNCVKVEKDTFVLSEIDDEFYAKNVSANFGEIGIRIKELMNDFQQRAKTHRAIESIADMKSFVDEYPLFKKTAGNVTKHVTIVSQLSKLVGDNNLLEISELEQSIVVDGDHGRCLDRLRQLLAHPKTTQLNATRLLMLYTLRFQNHANNEIRSLLKLKDFTTEVETLVKYAGLSRRRNDLFKEGNPIEITKKFIKGLKGVENIYTQHAPALAQLLDQLARGRLPEQAYPHVNPESAGSTRLSNVIVFMVGGTTFAESAVVRAWNERRLTAAGVGLPAVLLASTHVHNSASFMDQLKAMRLN